VERFGSSSEDNLPPIKVIVVEGKEDITIKISDEGGGIPRSAIPLIWTYMYTTMENMDDLQNDFQASDFQAPMAGFGYGLPLSRLVSSDLLLLHCVASGANQQCPFSSMLGISVAIYA
jgi:pyruvate dehydrogenase kinase 2/3/4